MHTSMLGSVPPCPIGNKCRSREAQRGQALRLAGCRLVIGTVHPRPRLPRLPPPVAPRAPRLHGPRPCPPAGALPMGYLGLVLPLVIYGMTMTSLRLGFGASGVLRATGPGAPEGGLGQRGLPRAGRAARCVLPACACPAGLCCPWHSHRMLSWVTPFTHAPLHARRPFTWSPPLPRLGFAPLAHQSPNPSPQPHPPRPGLPASPPPCTHAWHVCAHRSRVPARTASPAVHGGNAQPVLQSPDGVRGAGALAGQRRLHALAAGRSVGWVQLPRCSVR